MLNDLDSHDDLPAIPKSYGNAMMICQHELANFYFLEDAKVFGLIGPWMDEAEQHIGRLVTLVWAEVQYPAATSAQKSICTVNIWNMKHMHLCTCTEADAVSNATATHTHLEAHSAHHV